MQIKPRAADGSSAVVMHRRGGPVRLKVCQRGYPPACSATDASLPPSLTLSITANSARLREGMYQEVDRWPAEVQSATVPAPSQNWTPATRMISP